MLGVRLQLLRPRCAVQRGHTGKLRLAKRQALPLQIAIARGDAKSGFLALGLALLGLDWVTALTGAATAVCNVGPGLGPIIGPVGNFATLPDSAKWLLSLGMLLGRLEIVTVLVLLTPAYWRH